jgi:alpha-tubulin suppressor-like RCC1 family protein
MKITTMLVTVLAMFHIIAAISNGNEAVTLVPMSSASITVTFDPQGGALGQQPEGKTVALNRTYGELPVPIRHGFSFHGWWTLANGSGALITPSVLVSTTAPAQMLYAKWAPIAMPPATSQYPLAAAKNSGDALPSSIAAGDSHSLFVTSDGSLWAMGANGHGQLGVSGTGKHYSPVQVVGYGIGSVVTVVAGDYHSMFVTSDGKLWAMGYNSYGQLGVSGSSDHSLPAQVVGHGTSSVTAVAAGAYHTLYITDDGNLWAMGKNDYGQLGDSTATTRRNPIHVASGVKAIAAGGDHSLYITNDKKLWGMGRNGMGSLGDGTTINRFAPVHIANDVVAISAGGDGIGRDFSLYISSDGNLWGMGTNYGNLGDGTYVNRINPVQAQGATGVIALAASTGYLHSLYVTGDGECWGMGDNRWGQIGVGTDVDTYYSPVMVALLKNVVSIAAGTGFSLFATNDGKLYATGGNSYGQLGDGTNDFHFSPVLVANNVMVNGVTNDGGNTGDGGKDSGNAGGSGGGGAASVPAFVLLGTLLASRALRRR